MGAFALSGGVGGVWGHMWSVAACGHRECVRSVAASVVSGGACGEVWAVAAWVASDEGWWRLVWGVHGVGVPKGIGGIWRVLDIAHRWRSRVMAAWAACERCSGHWWRVKERAKTSTWSRHTQHCVVTGIGHLTLERYKVN